MNGLLWTPAEIAVVEGAFGAYPESRRAAIAAAALVLPERTRRQVADYARRHRLGLPPLPMAGAAEYLGIEPKGGGPSRRAKRPKPVRLSEWLAEHRRCPNCGGWWMEVEYASEVLECINGCTVYLVAESVGVGG